MQKNRILEILILLVGIVFLASLITGIYMHFKPSIDKIKNDVIKEYDLIDYGENIDIDESTQEKITIKNGGNYNLSGNYNCITINTDNNIKLNLKDTNITCLDGPAINIENAKNLNIEILGTNNIESTTNENLDAAIYSKDNLLLSGEGKLIIKSNYDGIVSKNNLYIKNGSYEIDSIKDSIKAKDSIEIKNGIFNLKSYEDGIKTTNDKDSSRGYIIIDNGVFNINSSNDGIQAESYLSIKNGTFNITSGNGFLSKKDNNISSKGLKSETKTIIENGSFTLNTSDDSIHSNGTILISGGNYEVKTSDDAIHADTNLQIENGNINILSCYEGLESSVVTIKDGNIDIQASDDGINANGKDSVDNKKEDGVKNTNGKTTISGGNINIYSNGDGIDCNGIVLISGGNLIIQSTNIGADTCIDHVGLLKVTGGNIITVGNPGVTDNGPNDSSIPMLIANFKTPQNGNISISNISFEPTIYNYKQVLIASNDLISTKTYTLKTGNTTSQITIQKTGVTIYEEK